MTGGKSYQPGSSKSKGARAIGELHTKLGETIDWTKSAQDMDVTERMFYLRGRGYGIKTVGCIELSALLEKYIKEELTTSGARRMFRDLLETLISMVAQRADEQRDAEEAKKETQTNV